MKSKPTNASKLSNITLDILNSQKEMAVDISEIKTSLSYHIKRTDLLEDSVKIAREQLEKDMRPIKAHITLVNNSLKIIGGIAVLIGIVSGILEIFSYLRG